MAPSSKQQSGKGGINKGNARKQTPKKVGPIKPMKVIKPRPETRDLIRWTDDLDVQLLLAAYVACHEQGIKIPWDAAGKMLNTKIELTGSAIIQHLAKIRSRRVEAGLPVPPALKRGGGSRRVGNAGNSKAANAKSYESIWQVNSNMNDEYEEDIDVGVNSESDAYFDEDRQIERKHGNDKMRSHMKAQLNTVSGPYYNFQTKTAGHVKMEPELENVGSSVAGNADFLKPDEDFAKQGNIDETSDGNEDSDTEMSVYGMNKSSIEDDTSENEQKSNVVVLKIGTSKHAKAMLRKYEQPLPLTGISSYHHGIPGASSLYGMQGTGHHLERSGSKPAYHGGTAHQSLNDYGGFVHQGNSINRGGFNPYGGSAFQTGPTYRGNSHQGGPAYYGGLNHQVNFNPWESAYMPNAQFGHSGYEVHHSQSLATDSSENASSAIAPSEVPVVADFGVDPPLFSDNQDTSTNAFPIDWIDTSFNMWDD